jgi:GNAT superfamily N-acetyltransferase
MGKKFSVTEVTDKKSRKEFLMLPVRLYKHEKNWIRPLDVDIDRLFDPRYNKFFHHGTCIRWIIQDEEGATVGRVAAFIDRKQAYNYDQPTGGMGYFECIEDDDAALMLFNTCKNWLQENGMQAMDGPINFGERNQWWGLLVDGFTEPNYCTPYNFNYYQKLFESYGFKVYFKQYTYHRKIKGGVLNVVHKKAEKVLSNPDYSFRHLKKKHLAIYTEDFRTVYNKGWVKHTGVNKMSEVQAQNMIKKLKPMMDERLVWFAYYKNEPVGFFIMMPEINQILKYVNGKLNLWGKTIFLYHKMKGTCKKALGMLFGIVPEHQGKGLESALVIAFSKIAYSVGFPYTDLEMNWIGDFHPKMMHVAEQMGGKIFKTHITYRYLFNPLAEFKRAPVIG